MKKIPQTFVVGALDASEIYGGNLSQDGDV
jgi:hypothetical protein